MFCMFMRSKFIYQGQRSSDVKLQEKTENAKFDSIGRIIHLEPTQVINASRELQMSIGQRSHINVKDYQKSNHKIG